jgi:Na+/H+ antiporter NhaD/arsenite permease-like protein
LPVTTERFVFALVLATVLSLLVFRHAERQGNERATAWGIATFFFGLFAVVVYFTRYYLKRP